MKGRELGTLLRHHWARHRVVLGVMALGLGLFELVITRMAPAPNEVSWMTSIMAAVPPKLMALAGDQIATTTAGFLAIGYGHPFAMILLGAWTVRAASSALAGELGIGTMDLLASRPVSRTSIVVAGFMAVTLGLAVLVSAAWSGTALGLALRPLETSPLVFAPVALAAWLMFTAWGGIGLAISASRREGGQAIAWTTALIALSFVLDYVARLWDPVKELRPLSLFRYYEAHAIIRVGLESRNLAVLAGVAVTGSIAAILVFRWRDL